jgi:hypothetical protein
MDNQTGGLMIARQEEAASSLFRRWAGTPGVVEKSALVKKIALVALIH